MICGARYSALTAPATWLLVLMLAACGGSERDKLADRIEPGIAPEHTTDPAERRAIAETLADDAISLADETAQTAAAEAAAARQIEAQAGTPEEAMAADCAQMRLELDVLQRPSSEIRTPEETAEIPATLEKLKTRIAQNCDSR